MSALLRLAVALLMALVGLGTMSGPTHAATDSFAYHYTYDSAATLSTLTDDETERGPPITCDDAATPAAVDLSSRGSSACLKTAALDATAYDSPVLLAQVGGAGLRPRSPFSRSTGISRRSSGGMLPQRQRSVAADRRSRTSPMLTVSLGLLASVH